MRVTRTLGKLALQLPRRQSLTKSWLPATATLLSSATLCLAQASSGITGTITDNTGSIIPGATVTTVNTGTQATSNTVSSSAGSTPLLDSSPAATPLLSKLRASPPP